MSELLLRLQLVLDVGRDLDEVLLADPLPVPDEHHRLVGLRTKQHQHFGIAYSSFEHVCMARNEPFALRGCHC